MIHILIIEDDSTTALLLGAAIVMSTSSCFVETVGDGKVAMDLLSQKHFDVVITDINHPGLRGLEMISRIKSDPALRDIRIMVVSGAAYGLTVLDAMGRGADFVCTKPFDFLRFQRNLKKLIGHCA